MKIIFEKIILNIDVVIIIMGNRINVNIEAQEMVPRGESRLSNAPLVPTDEDLYLPRTTPVPELRVSCHLIPDSFILEDNNEFSFKFDALATTILTITTRITTVDRMNPINSKKNFSFQPGLNQIFRGWQLDLLSSLTDSTNRNKEIEIKLDCNLPAPHAEITVVSIQKSSELFQGKITSQSLLYREKIYELREVFGNPYQEERLECAICLSNKRDTVIIPCYHMCLCASCGNMLRAQATKKCPMCRTGNI